MKGIRFEVPPWRAGERCAFDLKRGQTLVEVLIALTVAVIGLVSIYQGIVQATRAESRRRFYEDCAAILDQQFEEFVAGGSSATDQPSQINPSILVTVLQDNATDIPDAGDLRKVTLTLKGPPGSPALAPVVTYYTAKVRLRKPDTGGK